jgi:hypothetical protein
MSFGVAGMSVVSSPQALSRLLTFSRCRESGGRNLDPGQGRGILFAAFPVRALTSAPKAATLLAAAMNPVTLVGAPW